MSYFKKPTPKVTSQAKIPWSVERPLINELSAAQAAGDVGEAGAVAGRLAELRNPLLTSGSTGAQNAGTILGIPKSVALGVIAPSVAAGLYTAKQPPEELGGEVTAEYDDNKAWWDNYLANLDSDYSVNPARLKSAQGGRIGRQEGGLMDLGGMEKDYRQEGGFVPIGGEEKADDVPARLSKNEFVFTADAVRAAGGGDIDAGAEVMENVMQNLEEGGKISEESQGEGAQGMFEVSERLSEVM
jgi:hypothetical protein